MCIPEIDVANVSRLCFKFWVCLIANYIFMSCDLSMYTVIWCVRELQMFLCVCLSYNNDNISSLYDVTRIRLWRHIRRGWVQWSDENSIVTAPTSSYLLCGYLYLFMSLWRHSYFPPLPCRNFSTHMHCGY